MSFSGFSQDLDEKGGKNMDKWGFQGVYVCMLLVMILCWGSMFQIFAFDVFQVGFLGSSCC